MKKTILLLWAAMLPITLLFAQTVEQKQEAYDQVKEWAVVKLTIAYIEDYRTNFKSTETPDDIKEPSHKLEFETYSWLIKHFYDFTSEINLDTVSRKLIDGDWKNAEKAVFKKYKQELVDNKDKNTFDEIGFTPKTSGTSRTDAIKEIQTKYQELIDSIEQAETDPPKETVFSGDTMIDDPTTTPKEPSENQDDIWFSIILGLLLFFVALSIILLYLNYSWSKTKIELNKKIRSLKKEQQNKTNVKHGSLSQLKNENEKLKQQISDLRGKIEEIESGKVAEHKSTATHETPSPSIEIEIPQPIENVIYFPSPFKDSAFTNEDASREKTPDSIYKVVFDEHAQIGTLLVIEDADFSKALNSPDSYLKTACTYDNEYNHNARYIKVVGKGEIKPVGEDWIVTKKVRIKFI